MWVGWVGMEKLSSSASTQLNSTSTQTRAEVSLISFFFYAQFLYQKVFTSLLGLLCYVYFSYFTHFSSFLISHFHSYTWFTILESILRFLFSVGIKFLIDTLT